MESDSQDLLAILRTIETQRLTDVIFGATAAIVVFAALYVVAALLIDVRRNANQRFVARLLSVVGSRGLWLAMLGVLAIQGIIGWSAFVHHPVKQRVIFVDLDGRFPKGAFVTLAVFTSVNNRISADRAGLMRIYSRAYYSPDPAALRSLAVGVTSKWVETARVSKQRFTTGPLGRTLGVDETFAYNVTKLGEHALKEHFDLAADDGHFVRHYFADNIEEVSVVEPFSVLGLASNTALWQTVGVLLPLFLAALGLSKDTQKKAPSF
ncbi:MAG: hypothetical protein WB609_01590 [Candidatus Cybelea sp.]